MHLVADSLLSSFQITKLSRLGACVTVNTCQLGGKGDLRPCCMLSACGEAPRGNFSMVSLLRKTAAAIELAVWGKVLHETEVARVAEDKKEGSDVGLWELPWGQLDSAPVDVR